jgi:CheY-like chemotaxis protein
LITDTVSFALRGSNVRSDFLIAPDLWLLDIDRGQISQVLSNLSINAKQAMPDGGVIEVRAENCLLEDNNQQNLAAGKYVRISLHDTGPGISEFDLSRIFDPYFTTKPGGTGLGLSMSYTILKKHQGHIGVHSSSQGGTTFDIYLPASESLQTEETYPDSCVSGGTGSLLVMDDDEAVKDTLRQILNYLGYSAEFVGDGSEAVRRYAEALEAGRRFDLVIMDLTIPGGMGGKEAIQHLKKIDTNVTAIVSSGYSNDPVMSNFREYGFAGMVLKPYRVGELSEQISKVLRKGSK